MMRLPDFLIIGGMKCGSTTLFRSLERHPLVFFPEDKEPADLCRDAVLTPAGRRRYAAHFARARAEKRCGEASTDYTKYPDRCGVPQRAAEVLGTDTPLVYVMRDPIDRLLSHHRHEGAKRSAPASADDAIETMPELIAYSRYATQLEQWTAVFPIERILPIRFEDLTDDTLGQTRRVCAHLGLDPDAIATAGESANAFNRSEGKPIATGPWRLLAHSSLYRRYIRPILPRDARDSLRRKLLPKASFSQEPPSRPTLERLVGLFEPEVSRLTEMLGNRAPRWDLRTRWIGDATAGGDRTAAREHA